MKQVKIERKGLIFKDVFKIEEAFVSYELYNGKMSKTIRRLSFERGDAVAVLVYNKEDQKVILTEQFRYPTVGHGDGWLIEAAAGVIDKGETPEMTAIREVEEEVGFKVDKLVHISTFYTTPGGSSERIILFYAEVENSHHISKGGGLENEHEDIRIIEWSLPELWEALDSGKIKDAKSIIALMWLKNKLNAEILMES